MTETLFCYCCRVHHDKSQMRLFATGRGRRWRCLRSIEAAARNHRERDDFGRQQSAINREAARRAVESGQHPPAATRLAPARLDGRPLTF